MRQLWISLKLVAYERLEFLACRFLQAHNVFVTKDLMHRKIRENQKVRRSVIYNGIDPAIALAQVDPNPFENSGVFRFVCLGRLEAVKSLDVALAALKSVYRDNNCSLEIVGNGSEDTYLKEHSRQLGLDAVAKFHGFQTNPYPFMRHANCLLIPSAHEGLPYTLLEAMALGTPIIATRVGGLAEILEDEKTALLVPHGDVDALANAMHRLMLNSNLQKALVANAQALLRSQFTLARMVDQYLSVYRELVH
jgi:glycosyltransferase involved in cell wall biosynthesis